MFEIGSSLREARARQGLDVNELELRTKIRAKYLRALEEERFEQLPGHTYVKGFLRTYADSLGLDGQLYVDEYNSRFVAGDEETPLRARRTTTTPPRARARRDRRESRVLLVALGLIVAVTALVIAAWRFGSPEEEQVAGLSPTERRAATSQSATGARATLIVRAARGDSFMEVRAGSRGGAQLYSGTLERGQLQRFVRRSIYVSFGSPANVVVKLNGNRVTLPPGGAYLVTPRGVRAAS
jgi:cytoskeletal protein RodZ